MNIRKSVKFIWHVKNTGIVLFSDYFIFLHYNFKMTEERKLLQFVPYESCVEHTFWYKFTKLKLDVDMLEEKKRYIWGHYSPHYHRILNVDCTSFNR